MRLLVSKPKLTASQEMDEINITPKVSIHTTRMILLKINQNRFIVSEKKCY